MIQNLQTAAELVDQALGLCDLREMEFSVAVLRVNKANCIVMTVLPWFILPGTLL